MKKYKFLFIVLSIIFIIPSCKMKNVHSMQGDTKVETGIESRKYKDVEGELYYVIVLGEHGDEMAARTLALNIAGIEFGKKAQQMVTALFEREISQTLRNKVGNLNNDEQASALTKAATNYMVLEEDQLYYNQDQGLYKYRAVYKLEMDKIEKFLNESV